MFRVRCIVLFFGLLGTVLAEQWSVVGTPAPFEAEYAGIKGSSLVLRGANGIHREFPLESFSPENQVRLFELESENGRPFSFPGQSSLTTPGAYQTRELAKPGSQPLQLTGTDSLTITDAIRSLEGVVNFTSPDAWLFLEKVPASLASGKFLDKILVYGEPAVAGENLRVVQYASGSVLIPHGADFPAMTLFASGGFDGPSMPVKCHSSESVIREMSTIGSFRLKRGYMATLAKNPDGTGPSRNYVAQDHDIEVPAMPAGLDEGVGFLRVFPWRWTHKKGVAGPIWKNLNVGWFYDWNISTQSSLDIEYVPIRQNRWWPGLKQDWKVRGSLHLLGFNEPDRPDQAKMTVDEAIKAWPELLRTGLRLGSPAPSDGGLNWLYQFMDRADAEGLRVDFVAVHYYRAHSNPGDAKGAARQFQGFLKGVHDRVKRPLWITEWNNGANWTTAPDPNEKEQRDAIREMIRMLDETPYVERYAIYNWVEDVRHVQRKDGSLTPAGEVYRDQASPPAYQQQRPRH